MKKKKRAYPRIKLISLLVLIFVFGILLGKFTNFNGDVNERFEGSISRFLIVDKSEDVRVSSIKIPAVDAQGNGVSTELLIEVYPGNGKTLVDIDTLLYWADTQDSIRMAKEVAANVTGMDLSKYDISYHIDANASLIGGPSAGSAIAIATVAALQNKTLKEDVMITGTINHDGSIGPVGEITGKAKASKDVGAILFLVPLLQSNEITYETHEYCRKIVFTEFCTIEQIPKKVNVGAEAGIEVREVGSVLEALEYFYE
ncbi:MAG: hypothetical protein ISS82_05465 [Nanoarchaeota archaeon]|nr:hypothetical protein [Nanoarchaeota archaeon]